jgi:hypothetical protein
LIAFSLLRSFILTRCRVLNGFISRWVLKNPLEMLSFEPTAAQETGFFPGIRGFYQEFWQKPGFCAPPLNLPERIG